jgi:hypothetical protein
MVYGGSRQTKGKKINEYTGNECNVQKREN